MPAEYSRLVKNFDEWIERKKTLPEPEIKKIEDKLNKLKWIEGQSYEEWLRKRKQTEESEVWKAAERQRKQEEKAYTIDLPGLSDIFKLPIPALDNPDLKKARAIRFFTKKSPIPEDINWVPGVINQIDDAQDLLTTALWLGKPLLRRLPSRFIPFVGWALTLSDLANLSTMILSMSMTPGLTKPDVYKRFKDMKFKKKDMPLKVAKWLKPGGWRRKMGDVLQAAQALDTITGVGLQLGTIMGAVSDSMWGLYRYATGKKVQVRLPPPEDLGGKALRYLGAKNTTYQLQDLLSPEDHELLIAAENIAAGEAISSGIIIDDEKTDFMMDQYFPVMMPWERSTIEALEDAGYDLSKENFYKPYLPKVDPTFSDSIDLSFKSFGTVFPPYWKYGDPLPWGITFVPPAMFPPTWRPRNPLPPGITITPPEYSMTQRREIGTGERGSLFWLMSKEAGMNSLSYATGWEEDEIMEYTKEQISAIKLTEYNLKLVPGIWPIDTMKWFNTALAMAEASRRNYASIEDFKNAAQMYGGLMYPKY